MTDKRFTFEEKSLMFKLRTSMIDVKCNFKSCLNGQQTPNHLLQCPVVRRNCLELPSNTEVQYEDIFSEVDKQLAAVKLLSQLS